MSLKWKIIIGLSLAGAVVALIYIRRNSSEYLAEQIKKLGGTTGDVSSFDKPFLKAWLNALKLNQGAKMPELLFKYQNRYYNTIGGRGAVV
jgi:hypothetical protein